MIEVWAIAIIGGGAASVLASYLLGYLALGRVPDAPLHLKSLSPPLQVTVYPAVANPASDAQVTLYVSGAHKGDLLTIRQSDSRGLGPGHSATVTDSRGNYGEWVQLHDSNGLPLSGLQKFEVTDQASGSRGIAWLTLPVSPPPPGPVVPTATEDFGPRLPALTWIHRPHYVTLDSIVDDPEYGDQRAFLRVVSVKNYDPNPQTWRQTYRVHDGELIAFEMLIFNDSAPYLHLATSGGRASLLVTRMAARTVMVRGEVTASNAAPRVRWDTVKLAADRPFRVIPVEHSTKLWSRYLRPLIEKGDVFSAAGVPFGDHGADGNFGPSLRYWGSGITVRARIVFQQ